VRGLIIAGLLALPVSALAGDRTEYGVSGYWKVVGVESNGMKSCAIATDYPNVGSFGLSVYSFPNGQRDTGLSWSDFQKVTAATMSLRFDNKFFGGIDPKPWENLLTVHISNTDLLATFDLMHQYQIQGKLAQLNVGSKTYNVNLTGFVESLEFLGVCFKAIGMQPAQ
jgi:hypothetical protein